MYTMRNVMTRRIIAKPGSRRKLNLQTRDETT